MMQLKNIALSLLVLLLMPVESVFAQADLKAQQENWITLAASMYDRRDFDGAVTLLKSVIEQAPDNDAAYYYLALSSLGKGEAEAAEAYLRQAVELDGGNFWYRQRLAALYAATT
ncbi:MAG: tetratricopeptide repeat protein, partial [Bacteroidales bacterium]|nr:tetratricopeptide repeat protein [Bacteroidales bacterium]